MSGAVYNLAIPNAIPSLVSRALRPASCLHVAVQFTCVLLGLAIAAQAADWSGPELQLARKIVAVTGSGSIALTVANRSSLGRRDSEIIQNGLRSALQGLGVRVGKEQKAATTVAISLSENPTSYVWVAEIHRGTDSSTNRSIDEDTVVMVSAPRSAGSTPSRESVPLSLRRIPLWSQNDPILDIAVLEEGATPTRIAVLDPERVSLYRQQAGTWQQEQSLGIAHARPWPRDVRGKVVPAKDHLLDIYLPGLACRANVEGSITLTCRETDDPWPLVPAALSGGTFPVFPSAGSTSVAIPAVGAFYASTRNFFTGALTPGAGKVTTVAKFYSAALLPREKYLLWLFAGTDGHTHIVDGSGDQIASLNWGSDLASVKTTCGAGWQVLATSSERNGDSVRAYEFPDRDPIAVSAPIEFPGAIVALWTEAKADTAVAVMRNRETGGYEAFRLAVSCSQ
jgi:hypothetical protein